MGKGTKTLYSGPVLPVGTTESPSPLTSTILFPPPTTLNQVSLPAHRESGLSPRLLAFSVDCFSRLEGLPRRDTLCTKEQA